MRLHLSIYRHALPAVHILFSTGSGPASHTALNSSTIADLLTDVHLLVPLESADGEWGLEDYVVEVVTPSSSGLDRPSSDLLKYDQKAAFMSLRKKGWLSKTTYEVLHFQVIQEVLREDDEVVIRPLESRELKDRRLGGRHQISGDGKHLIDGVGWGKEWLRPDNGRPGVKIPARKKRRLLQEDDNDSREKILMKFVQDLERMNSEDEDEDTEFLPGDDEGRTNLLRITEKGELEESDLDEDEDMSSSSQTSSATENSDETESEGWQRKSSTLEDEIKELLEDAENDVELLRQKSREWKGAKAMPPVSDRRSIATSASGKRKRDVLDEGEDVQDDSAFEGFSTPARQSGVLLNKVDDDTTSVSSDSDNDSMLETADESSSSDSDAESTPKEARAGLVPRKAKKVRMVADKGTSEDNEDQDQDDWSSDSDTDSTSESGSDSETSSSGSDSVREQDPDSSTTTSSSSVTDSSSTDESDSASVKLPRPDSKVLQPFKQPSSTPIETSSIKKAQTPPGMGTPNTHRNNLRIKRRKRLNSLKAQGLLQADADFTVLAAYESVLDRVRTETEASGIQMEEKKAKLIEELETHSNAEISLIETEKANILTQPPPLNNKYTQADEEEDEKSVTMEKLVVQDRPESGHIQEGTMSEPPKKRARLDIAASRRLLFGSLGLKNPKTPAAEQELREKLSQSVRKERVIASTSKEVPVSNAENESASNLANESWRGKLIISAVECEVQGLKLKPPPFPFKQGWDKGAKARINKLKAMRDPQYYDGGPEDTPGYAPDVSSLGVDVIGDETPTVESRTVSADDHAVEDIPVPTDFGNLSSLQVENIVPGVIIAFKELYVTLQGRPEVSDYRVARVLDVHEDGIIKYILSKRDRDAVMQSRYDKATGERIYSRFDVPIDQTEQPEEGLEAEHTRPFEELMDSRLVRAASTVQVAESDVGVQQKNAQTQEESAVIPDSKPDNILDALEPRESDEPLHQDIDVATPRRDEITTMIRDAGFDSAINEKLRHPIPTLHDGGEGPSPEFGSSRRVRDEQISTEPTEKPEMPSINTSGFDSPQFNGWSSSPLRDSRGGHGNSHIDDNSPQISHVTAQEEQATAKALVDDAHDEVHYPHVSQLELESSMISNPESSSHQDAQPADEFEAAEADITRLDDEPDQNSTKLINDDDHMVGEALQAATPKSTVDPSQPEIPEPVQQQPSPLANSFLGGQRDGPDSSDDEIEGLPSLQSLTSSQAEQRTEHSSHVPKSSASARISPPPLKKAGSLRSGKMRQSKESTPASSEGRNKENQEPNIKVSASQQERIGLSQIPTSSQFVVDLTMSSDPVSPGNSDGEFFLRMNSRKRASGGKRDGRKGGSQKNEDGKARAVSEGLGERRLLVKRKAKSQI